MTVAALSLERLLRPPPGMMQLPEFRGGWRLASETAPFLAYDAPPEGWSSDLEELHAAATADHPIDVLTRELAVAGLRGGRLGPAPALADLGCSSGHLLADLRAAWPDALCIGVDAESSGLVAAHDVLPGLPLIRADVGRLPFVDSALDGVAAINVLEHVLDDAGALLEIRRILRPGGRAVLAVPANPRLYDYYDAHLRHERRYGPGELAAAARAAGLLPAARTHVGALLYPAFWAVKKRNRVRGPLSEDEAAARVRRDIDRTRHGRAAGAALWAEERLARRGARFARGIREMLVVRAPAD